MWLIFCLKKNTQNLLRVKISNYLPTTAKEYEQMLKIIGVNSVDELFSDIPKELRAKKLDIPLGLSQQEVREFMLKLSEKNKVYKCILRGAGSYKHYIPPAVKALSGRSEFVTAYTPYQAEISQGILQSIFEYQSYICRLTGMDVSNASHYSGATAAAEAILMCATAEKNCVVVSSCVNPNTLEVIKTYLNRRNIVLSIVPCESGVLDADVLKKRMSSNVCAVYLEQPNYYGLIESVENISQCVHSFGAKVICGCNPISLALLKSPAECGVDIATGEAQPLGIDICFGGPYLGFIACKSADVRKLPGRVVGKTVDTKGNDAYVLTLQAREQHIRRERATSNICSNQAHCALTAAVYLSTMGHDGLKDVAKTCLSNAHYFADELTKIKGVSLKFQKHFFHEFVTVTDKTDSILQSLEQNNILGGLKIADDQILWCVTEECSKDNLDMALDIIKEVAV